MGSGARLAAVAALAFRVVACGSPAATGPRPDLLLVVVDTLRADHLGCYGHGRDTSPAIDAFAASAVRFEAAYATAPWTMPSVATALTGLHPTVHGVTALARLPDDVPTLAGILARAGYRTGAVVSHRLAGRLPGFDRGFELFDEGQARGHRYMSTPGVVRRARELLDTLAGGDEPFFLFVHLFDPHYDYLRHPRIGFAPPRAGSLDGDERIDDLRARLGDLTPEEIGFLSDLYDEEIRFTDRGVGTLLRILARRGLADGTLVVLTADHGEELVGRGWLGHTRTLYEELVRVPLLVRGPGVAAPRTVDAPVSLVSLLPTLLELMGVPRDGVAAEGPSLAPLLRGAGPPPREPVFFEVDFTRPEVRKKGIRDGRYKLIRDDATGAVELYDLERDPGERDDLAASHPELVERYAARLDAHRARVEAHRRAPVPVEFSPREVRALRALGYVEGR